MHSISINLGGLLRDDDTLLRAFHFLVIDGSLLILNLFLLHRDAILQLLYHNHLLFDFNHVVRDLLLQLHLCLFVLEDLID